MALLKLHGAHDLERQIRRELVGRDPLYEEPDVWLDDGACVHLRDRTLVVSHTPGHTRGHVVFRDPEAGLLFSGDHVLPRITPSIAFEPAPVPLALVQYLDSLARVRAEPDVRLLPAHGPPRPSVHVRIDELLDHHRVRLEESRQAIHRGATTGFEVAQRLRWARNARRLEERDLFNRMLAVLEAAAHLECLAASGDMSSEDVEGVRRFVLA